MDMGRFELSIRVSQVNKVSQAHDPGALLALRGYRFPYRCFCVAWPNEELRSEVHGGPAPHVSL